MNKPKYYSFFIRIPFPFSSAWRPHIYCGGTYLSPAERLCPHQRGRQYSHGEGSISVRHRGSLMPSVTPLTKYQVVSKIDICHSLCFSLCSQHSAYCLAERLQLHYKHAAPSILLLHHFQNICPIIT